MNMIETLEQFAKIPPFCADQLPVPLRQYTEELAARYTVPQEELVLACLATAGMAGRRFVTAELGWGAGRVSPGILAVFGAEPASNLSLALQHIVEPFVQRQRAFLKSRELFVAVKVDKQLEHPRLRLLGANLERETQGRYLAEVDRFVRIARPIVLATGLDRPTLLQALVDTADGTLFACNEMGFQDGPIGKSSNGRIDVNLVERCLDGCPVTETLRRSKVYVADPALGGVLVSSPPGLSLWFAQFGASAALGNGLLLLDSQAKPAPIKADALQRIAHQQEWSHRLNLLLDPSNPEPIPLPTPPTVLKIIFSLRNAVTKSASPLPPATQKLVNAMYGLATRLFVGLHLVNDLSRGILDQTATTAVALAQYYHARQINSWLRAHRDGENPVRDSGSGTEQSNLSHPELPTSQSAQDGKTAAPEGSKN